MSDTPDRGEARKWLSIAASAAGLLALLVAAILYMAGKASAETVDAIGNRVTATEVEIRLMRDDVRFIRRKVERRWGKDEGDLLDGGVK